MERRKREERHRYEKGSWKELPFWPQRNPKRINGSNSDQAPSQLYPMFESSDIPCFNQTTQDRMFSPTSTQKLFDVRSFSRSVIHRKCLVMDICETMPSLLSIGKMWLRLETEWNDLPVAVIPVQFISMPEGRAVLVVRCGSCVY
ncbi:hypothetical protein TNCV_2846731 [Trichonephila clavipes]|nr:hypothetical protein TNCV_2846731 [Trichonephila clavipes]